jgi:monothiol glutaredoxin
MSLSPELQQRIVGLLASSRVVLFMKGDPQAPQCGFSARAVAVLQDLDIEFAAVDVLADGAIRDGIKEFGQWPTIPQLYVDGQLIGGSDIVEQMAHSGELHAALGLPAPDRTPPAVTVTPAAAAMLHEALRNAGEGHVLKVAIDAGFAARLQLAPPDPHAITTRCGDIDLQFDPASARRADGMTIDWVDDARGRGLVIDNPNAPPAVRPLSPVEAASKLAAGALTLVDVRPPQERAFAAVRAPMLTFDDGPAAVEALPKDTPLAFLCHHGNRSRQAAEQFRALGFSEVYNVEGGIEAWATADPSIPHY